MKTLNNLLPKFNRDGPLMVEYQMVMGGYHQLEEPTLSTEITCKVCGGHEHTTFRKFPSKESPFVWFCNNPNCAAVIQKLSSSQGITPTQVRRCVVWPLFCEMNGLGDSYHEVKFENLNQSQGKIDYLKKFCVTPKGIILMYGNTGTGKTYSALATCELFTRTSASALFTTQKQMAEKWYEALRDPCNNYIERIRSVSILIIDDFGTAEMTPNYLSFFMDLMNTRMQWTNRGTIITTNLTPQKFASYCGDALSDRINTGQLMSFEGKSNRKQVIL